MPWCTDARRTPLPRIRKNWGGQDTGALDREGGELLSTRNTKKRVGENSKYADQKGSVARSKL